MATLAEKILPFLPHTTEAEDLKIARQVVTMVLDEVRGKVFPKRVEQVTLARAYLVASRSSEEPASYLVMVSPEMWCPCKDFAVRAPRICVHIQDALHADDIVREKVDVIRAIAPPTPSAS